jgi:hypothetical protein
VETLLEPPSFKPAPDRNTSSRSSIHTPDHEPGTAFIRLTWANNNSASLHGHLDRLVAAGSVLCKRWQVVRFARNDNHADVYYVEQIKPCSSRNEHLEKIEAHLFLDEYHGNSKVYARRKQERMQRSDNCRDKFWYRNRLVLVMRVSNVTEPYLLRNTQAEFPILVDQEKLAKALAVRSCMSDKVLDGVYLSSLRTPPDNDAMERIEKSREKKARKQRLKRKVKRELRFRSDVLVPIA